MAGDVRGQAAVRVEQLKSALANAQAKWQSWNVRLTGALGIANPEQVRGALRSMGDNLDKWQARSLSIPVTDQAAWNAWLKFGDDLARDLASTAQDSGIVKLTTIIADTAAATGNDVAKGAAQAAAAVRNWWKPVALGVAALVVLVIVLRVRGLLKLVGI